MTQSPAARLKRFRQVTGLSQRKMAARLTDWSGVAVSYGMIQRLENGLQRMPRADVAVVLRDFMVYLGGDPIFLEDWVE